MTWLYVSRPWLQCGGRALSVISDCVMPAKRRLGGTAGASDDGDGSADGEPDGSVADNAPAAVQGKNDLGPSSVTLSGLLNAIDGVASQVSSTSTLSNHADRGVTGRLGPLCLDKLPRETRRSTPTTGPV